jgi:tyrosyl-tRNA synthetase
MDPVAALTLSGLASSKAEARRLLSDRSVYVNGTRVDAERILGLADALHGRWIVLRRGKHSQHVLRVEG